jgi:hypothetical protein
MTLDITNPQIGSINILESLTTNDYIELWIQNNVGSNTNIVGDLQ